MKGNHVHCFTTFPSVQIVEEIYKRALLLDVREAPTEPCTVI